MEGDLQRILGQNLRRHRHSLELSQEAFAAYLGVHRTYMSQLERGLRNISLRQLERIAAKVEVDPQSLLLDSGERS